MNVIDAAYHVVRDYPGGADSLAPRLSKAGGVLSAEVARRGTAKFGLETAVQVTQLSGDLRILHAFALECGQMCIPLPEAVSLEGNDVLQALGEASQEFADLCREVCSDMADGVISDNDQARIDRARGKLLAKLHQLGAAIRARNLAAKPAFARGEGGAA